MTAFLTKALCQGKGAGLPLWWPLGHVGTIALILTYVAVARYVRASVYFVVYGWVCVMCLVLHGCIESPCTYNPPSIHPSQPTTPPTTHIHTHPSRSSWRVHSGLHTPAQIIVGACVGSAVGASWHELCTRGELNARVLGFLSRFPGSQVPLPYLAGVMVVGALTVGSVERKIAKAMKRIVAKGKGKKKKEGEKKAG